MQCRRCGGATGGPLCERCAALDETVDTPPDSGLDGATVHEPPADDTVAEKPPRSMPVPDGYELDQLLGEGAMGVVYKAHHRELDRVVAIKYLSVMHEELRRRFLREGQILSDLRHPNVISVYGSDVKNGIPLLIFEFVEGKDLDAILRETGKMPLKRALRYVDQALAGLGHAHDSRIIHRDLKPQNMLVTRENVLKLADFGISSSLEGVEQWTRTGLVMGTPDYMSPEQTLSARVDHRADLYAMGVILYQLVTGSVPFPGGSGLDKLRRHREEPAPMADALEPSLSPGMVALLARALEKDPDRRFQSAAEMREALAVRGVSSLDDLVEVGEQPRPDDASGTGPGNTPARRRTRRTRNTATARVVIDPEVPAARWKIAAGVVLALALGAGLFHQASRPRVVPPVPVGHDLQLVLTGDRLTVPLPIPPDTQARAKFESSGARTFDLPLEPDGRGGLVARLEPGWVLDSGHIQLTVWRPGEEESPTRAERTVPLLGAPIREMARRMALESKLIEDVTRPPSVGASPATTSSVQLARLANVLDVSVSAEHLWWAISPDRPGKDDDGVRDSRRQDTRRVLQLLAEEVGKQLKDELDRCWIMLAEPGLGGEDMAAVLAVSTPLRLLDRLLLVHGMTELRLELVQDIDRWFSRGPQGDREGNWWMSHGYAGPVRVLASTGVDDAATLDVIALYEEKEDEKGARHQLDCPFAIDLSEDRKPTDPQAQARLAIGAVDPVKATAPDVIWALLDGKYLLLYHEGMKTGRRLSHTVHPDWIRGDTHSLVVSRDVLEGRDGVMPYLRLNHLEVYWPRR